MRLALPLLLLLPGLSCAADRGGREVPEALEWLLPGSTPESRLIQELGEPWRLRETRDGTRYLTWSSFVVGLYGGPWQDESEFVTFVVRDGVVQEVHRGPWWRG